ncbi:MAG: gamma-glutamylcyclotransferase family protein [Pseudomonadota bacterium]
MIRPLLFVYGTLRRGASAQGLMASARFVARLELAARHDMRSRGQYPVVWFPGRRRVVGECYAVSPLLLRRLDRFEQTPHAYRRRLVRTPIGWAWMYRCDGTHGKRCGRVVRQGDWMKQPGRLAGTVAGRYKTTRSGVYARG